MHNGGGYLHLMKVRGVPSHHGPCDNDSRHLQRSHPHSEAYSHPHSDAYPLYLKKAAAQILFCIASHRRRTLLQPLSSYPRLPAVQADALIRGASDEAAAAGRDLSTVPTLALQAWRPQHPHEVLGMRLDRGEQAAAAGLRGEARGGGRR